VSYVQSLVNLVLLNLCLSKGTIVCVMSIIIIIIITSIMEYMRGE
jgi:hypothetical protein